MSLQALFSNALPFNRKERFFTGTIFPGIVCRDNFRYLPVLLKELAPNMSFEVEWSSAHKNILFYTEYNLKESLMGLTADATLINLRGDTPDILFIIFDKGTVHLFALEAKMYDTPTEDKLQEQMKYQRVILEEIVRLLQPVSYQIYHIALLPEKLYQSYPQKKVPCITWERIAQLYTDLCPGDYNLEILDYALKQYNRLVAKKSGPNGKGKLTGLDIFNKYEELEIRCIGRGGGLKGDAFLADIQKGTWKEQVYEWTNEQEPPNRNWFTIADFITHVRKS